MFLQTPAEPLDFLILLTSSVGAAILDAVLGRRLSRELGWGYELSAFYSRLFGAIGQYTNALIRVAAAFLIPIAYGSAVFLAGLSCSWQLCSPQVPSSPLWEIAVGWLIGTVALVLEDSLRYRLNRPHRPREAVSTRRRWLVGMIRTFGPAVSVLIAGVVVYWSYSDSSLLGIAAVFLLHQFVSEPRTARPRHPRWGRDASRRVGGRSAATILVLTIVLILILNVSWMWSGSDMRQTTRVNVSGTWTFDAATRVSAFTRDFTLEGNASPEIEGYAPNVVATNVIPYYLWFDQPASGQTVVVSNATQTLFRQAAPDFELDVSTISACSLLVLSQTPYTLATYLNMPMAVQAALSQYGNGLTLAAYGNQGTSGILTNLEVTGTPDGVATLKCNNPAFSVNGTRFSYSGPCFLSVSGFAGIRGGMWVSEGSLLDVYGEWTFSARNVNATFAYGSGSAWTPSGTAEVIRQNATVLDASQFSMSQGPTPQGSAANVVTWSQQAGYTYVTKGTPGAILMGSSEAFVANVQDSTLRWGMTGLSVLIGIAAVLISLNELMGGGRRRGGSAWVKRRSFAPASEFSRTSRRSAAVAVAALLVLGLPFTGYVLDAGLRGMAPAYFYSRFPTTLDIWYDRGVNRDFTYIATRIFLWEAERLVGLRVIGITNHTFDSGGPHVYNDTDSQLWLPAGSIGLDRAEIWLGEPIPLQITYLSGRGIGFAGVNNFGTSIVIFPDMYSSTLNLVATLLHEFGHALGFVHDPCSPIMTNDTASNTRLAFSAVGLPDLNDSYRGIELNEALLNGSFTGFADWGSLVGRADDVSTVRGPNALYRTDSLVYFDSSNNSLHEVLWEQDLNETSGAVTYSSFIFTAPPNVFLLSWSTAEELYMQESLAGFPASSPPIGQC